MRPDASAFLLSLHRAARRLRHPAFRDWVFDELATCVRFDSGFWLRTTISADGPVVHDQYLYRQRPDRLTAYMSEQLWRVDPFTTAALDKPWSTMMMSCSDIPAQRLRDFLSSHGQAHALAMGAVGLVTRVVTGLATFRRDPADRFDDGDRQFFEVVGPHVMDTWNHNWLQTLGAEIDPSVSGHARAVLNASEMIETADDHFELRMQREWPEWLGPFLPEPLIVHLGSGAPGPYVGARTIARFEHLPEVDFTLVRLRDRHALDDLSPRKQAVARLFAGGASQTEVSARLKLAPSTINNYLVEIYRRLEVSDKAQLALCVARVPE